MGVRGRARKKDHTPVMQQFLRAKGKYPDAIVFFRLGDFYEMFYDDAVRAAAVLDIALTSRGTGPDGNRIPMARLRFPAGRYSTCGMRIQLTPAAATTSPTTVVSRSRILRCRVRFTLTT